MKKRFTPTTNRWTAADKQAFGDGNRTRAQTIQGKRAPGPSVSEWLLKGDTQNDDGTYDWSDFDAEEAS